jgi:hypothetical protein
MRMADYLTRHPWSKWLEEQDGRQMTRSAGFIFAAGNVTVRK